MIFGRKLRNTDPKQMLDHINYMQGRLEEEFEQRRKDFAEKISAQEAEIKKLTDRIKALESASETEE